MRLPLLCLLAFSSGSIIAGPAIAGSVIAGPVHVTLKASSAASPNSDGFLTLGSVAGLTGGDKAARTRFAAVLVARAPLQGESRQLTRGDLALKLRQAGINPDTQAVLEGADRAVVTTDMAASSDSPPAPNSGAVRAGSVPNLTSSELGAGGPPAPVVHPGDSVTIYIQAGSMTITAPATVRESGKVGDTIRVHRDGVMSDLSVQVLDAQTVQMEI